MTEKLYCKYALSFDDVLILPQHSDVASRELPSVVTKLTKNVEIAHPVVSTNMSTVTETPMMLQMWKSKSFGVLHRFMDTNEFKKQMKEFVFGAQSFDMFVPIEAAISVGVKGEELDNGWLDLPCIRIAVVDVAHGDSQSVIDTIKRIKSEYPHIDVIGGNIATKDGFRRLVDAGADGVRVGIGGGCHAAGTRILMANGFYKNIENIQCGDEIINLHGMPVKVKRMWSSGIKTVCKIKNNNFHSSTYVTPEHEYYVSSLSDYAISTIKSRSYKSLINESNIKWKPIGDCNDDKHFGLIPHKIQYKIHSDFDLFFLPKTLKSSYELGYLFGTFLGDGHCGQQKISWTLGRDKKNKGVLEKIQSYCELLFDCNFRINNRGNSFNCGFNNPKVINLFSMFYDTNKQKRFPEFLLVNNKRYLDGIFDGLIDSDGSTHKNGGYEFYNSSIYVVELLITICQLLDYGYPTVRSAERTNGFIEGRRVSRKKSFACFINKNNQSYKDLSHTKMCLSKFKYEKKNVLAQMEVFDIEVDCPTQSLIANNVIIHNSACTTRIVTGHGMPTLASIIDCADVSRETGVPMIADGGIKNSGDAVKALAFGASVVCLGNVLAGTSDTPGAVMELPTGKFKEYYGMSSATAQNRLKSGKRRGVAAEGIDKLIPYKGDTEDVLLDFVGGIKSGLAYSGVMDIHQLREEFEYIILSPGSMKESKFS